MKSSTSYLFLWSQLQRFCTEKSIVLKDEYCFDLENGGTRKFRSDFYLENDMKKMAIEVQGGLYSFYATTKRGIAKVSKGGHTSLTGYKKDIEKINYLTKHGIYIVLIESNDAKDSDTCIAFLRKFVFIHF